MDEWLDSMKFAVALNSVGSDDSDGGDDSDEDNGGCDIVGNSQMNCINKLLC